MHIVARRKVGRAFLAPLVALVLIIGYIAYVQVGPGSGVRHTGAPAPAKANLAKLTPADLLLAATTASSIHLEYDGVTGIASTTHTNHALITSFQFGVGVQAPTPGGGGTTKPSVSDITMTKATDKYTVPFLTKTFKAVSAPNAIVYFTGANTAGGPVDYLEFDLKNAFITGFSLASGGDNPSESLSLNFTALTIKAHINGANPQQVTYNITTNTTT